MPQKPPPPPHSSPFSGQFVLSVGLSANTVKQLWAICERRPRATIADTVARLVAEEFVRLCVDGLDLSD